jgi:hypothetical protein
MRETCLGAMQGVASTAHALEGLVALCSKLGSQVHWKAVGTAALRDCCDPGPVADLVGKHLGAKLQVITGRGNSTCYWIVQFSSIGFIFIQPNLSWCFVLLCLLALQLLRKGPYHSQVLRRT